MRKMKKNVRRGKLKNPGVTLHEHEKMTVDFFLSLGKDLNLIMPSNTPGKKRPDFEMDGVEWEMKCPLTDSPVAIRRLFSSALLQSVNVIFDLRRMKNDEKAFKLLNQCFKKFRRVRRVMIITKNEELKIWRKRRK